MARQPDEVEAWERQPGESEVAYAAYVVYRNLRAGRSLRLVGQEVGKNRALMSRWSARHAWVERCEKFDRHEDRLAREAVIADIQEMAVRHTEQSKQLGEVLSLPVRALISRFHAEPVAVMEELVGMNTASLIRLVKTIAPALALAITTERMTRGEPTPLMDEPEDIDTAIATEALIPDDAERLAEVGAILHAAGVFDIAPGAEGADAEGDEVHPASPDTQTAGVPTTS